MAGIVLVAFAVPAALIAQPPARGSEETWAAFVSLIGTWQGEASGFGAVSDLTHAWSFAVQGNFLELRTRSVQRAENGEGEVHEDVGYLSLDKDTGTYVFRQFLSEGFVITFEVIVDGRSIRFRHRHSESAGGLRAQMRLTFVGENEYEMTLDLASPGKDFVTCQQMSLRRAR